MVTLANQECIVSNFGQNPQILIFVLYGKIIIDIGRNFPKLERMIFANFQLTENQFAQFLYLNPQLKNLCIDKCTTTDPINIVEIIAHFGHNIESIIFDIDINSNNALIPFSRLRNLIDLNLSYENHECLRNIFDSIAENDVHLEHLTCSRIFISDTDILTLQSIFKLKYLKTLTLGNITEDFLIHIVKKLTKLEEIYVSSENITHHGIIEILNYRKRLKRATFRQSPQPLVKRYIEEKYYYSILALAKDQIKVIINCYRCEVSTDDLNANSDWLKIIEDF